jgi:hypothetical protein
VRRQAFRVGEELAVYEPDDLAAKLPPLDRQSEREYLTVYDASLTDAS